MTTLLNKSCAKDVQPDHQPKSEFEMEKNVLHYLLNAKARMILS